MLLLVLFFAPKAHTRHLMGGNSGYEFIDTLANGNVRYKIYVYLYRNCDAQGSQSTIDNPMTLGIYNNNTTGNLVQTVFVPVTTQRSVTPTFGNSACSFQPNLCITEYYYEKIVTLLPSTNGYRFLYIRCCRNNSILNVQNSQGQSYYGVIPNTNLKNSSPRFNSIPLPYLCVNDIVTIDNSAVDANGDQITYQMAHPYGGGGTNNTGNVTFPFFSSPTLINYNGGYSATQPFGAGGISNLNVNTGFGTFKSTVVGDFVVAFDVIETRNGVVISKTRRDMQIFVLNCPPNSIPALGNSGGTPPQTTYNVNAGQLLSFPITVRDTNYMRVKSTSPLFAAGGTPLPLPTITSGFGKDSVTINFNWQIPCAAARNAPYTFQVEAIDSGCPRKTNIFDYYIYVNKGGTASAITGNNKFCPNAIETYTSNGSTTSTYTWSVTNGAIIGSSTNPSVVVQWGAIPSGGSVRFIEVTADGCVSNPVIYPVNVLNVPLPSAGIDQAICSGDTIFLGAANNPLYGYKWTPNTYLSNDTLANPRFIATNNTNANIIYTYYVDVDYNFVNCINYARRDTVNITVRPAVAAPTILGGSKACEFTPQTLRIANQNPPANNVWQVIQGGVLGAFSNDSAAINWQGIGTGIVKVTATDAFGCSSPPTVFTVNIQSKPNPGPIYGNVFICNGHLTQTYYLRNAGNSSQLVWNAVGGTIVRTNQDTVVVTWQLNSQIRSLSLVEKNALGCESTPIQINITFDNPSVEMISVSTLRFRPEVIEVKWRGLGLANFQGPYAFYYKATTSANWILGSFLAANQTSFRIENLDINNTKYEFKIVGLNACADTFATSNHWNIVLNSQFSEANDLTSLNWNPYTNWKNGVRSYELYVQNNQDTSFSLYKNLANNILTNDEVIDLQTYKQCFRVKARELSGNFAESWSNIQCLVYPPYVYVPNAFTPDDGNGINDLFEVKGGRVKTFELQIYDRWGELVFSSTTLGSKWDGTFNGKPAQSGVYVCLIKYTDGANWGGKKTTIINLMR